MGGCRCDDRLCFAQAAIGTLKLVEEARERTRADGYVLIDLDVAPAKFAENLFHPLACVWIFNPEKLLWQ